MDTQIRPVMLAPVEAAKRPTLSLPGRQSTVPSVPSSSLAAIEIKLRAAILRCAAQAQTDEPNDTEARLHSFVAKLSGNMESMGELELDQALWDLFGTPWPPAHSVLSAASSAGATKPIAGM